MCSTTCFWGCFPWTAMWLGQAGLCIWRQKAAVWASFAGLCCDLGGGHCRLHTNNPEVQDRCLGMPFQLTDTLWLWLPCAGHNRASLFLAVKIHSEYDRQCILIGAQRPVQKHSNTDRIKQQQKSSHYENLILPIRKLIHKPQSMLWESVFCRAFQGGNTLWWTSVRSCWKTKSLPKDGKKAAIVGWAVTSVATHSEHGTLLPPWFALTVNFSALKDSLSLHSQWKQYETFSITYVCFWKLEFLRKMSWTSYF